MNGKVKALAFYAPMKHYKCFRMRGGTLYPSMSFEIKMSGGFVVKIKDYYMHRRNFTTMPAIAFIAS